MRIVLDLQACQATSRNRGIGRYSLALALAVARHAGSHEIHIVLSARFPESFATIVEAFAGLVPSERISCYDIPVPADELSRDHAWRVRAAEQVREAYLVQLAPDIVHVASLFEGLIEDAPVAIGQGAGMNLGRYATAVTLYDLIPLLRKETYLNGEEVRAWYYRKLQSLKNSDLVLAISEHSRREAQAALQLASAQVVNISAAVDDAFQPRTLAPLALEDLRARHGLTRPFVMYTGGIDYRKNIEGLIEAFARLPPALRHAHQLAIICKVEPTERERLETLAGTFGLASDALVLTGYVSDDDLVGLYNATALFVFPSLQEGFGLPALEAMSCGAATIGSNTSSIPEVIGRADALFDPNDIDAITAKIAAVLTDAQFRHSLQRHGLQQAKRFSWDASARATLSAFEQVHAHRTQELQARAARVALAVVPFGGRRPRLAYVSPLPPERSGIADYSAQLLPELARHYDIEVVVEQTQIDDPWITANFPVRSAAWFEDHGDGFDRVLYHFGNSDFHVHMFPSLARHPGVVVLHDFFLSGIVNHIEVDAPWPNAFCRALYESHGYPALLHEQREGRVPAIYRYPCNKPVLEQATGVIVHSRYAMQLARDWYGPHAADDWRCIALLRAMPPPFDRDAARAALGVGKDDFLVCSFGHLGATKMNHRLLDVWLHSRLAQDRRCHLVYVGGGDPGYCKALEHTLMDHPAAARIKITGFAAPELYTGYLRAADLAVQLRGLSRGETSAAILDCMSYGIPTIANANGSTAELPDAALYMLPDDFHQAALHDALVTLWTDAARRRALSRAAVHCLESAYHPAQIGDAYHDAIEHFASNGTAVRQRELMGALAAIDTDATPTPADLIATAAAIVFNAPGSTPRQLLIDVTPLVAAGSGTGGKIAGDSSSNGITSAGNTSPVRSTQVAAAALRALILAPPPGFRVEPYHLVDGRLCYARHFTLALLGRPELVLPDAPLDLRRGDRLMRFAREAAGEWAVELVEVGQAWLDAAAAIASYVLLDAWVGARLAMDDHVGGSGGDPLDTTVASVPCEPADATDATDAPMLEAAATSPETRSDAAQLAKDSLTTTLSADPESSVAPGSTLGPPAPVSEAPADPASLEAILAKLEAQTANASRSAPQILIDITTLIRTDDKSGIQRVVRSILGALADTPPAGTSVRAVYHAGGYYAYASHVLPAGSDADADSDADAGPGNGLDHTSPAGPVEPVHLSAGDIFLGLDLSPNDVPGNRMLFEDFRRHGVRVLFVVYDLLPVRQPEAFVPGAAPWFGNWLDAISACADGLICISRAVADDLRAWITEHYPERLAHLRLGYFHLGADITGNLPSATSGAETTQLLAQIAGRPSFLMVGTLEPRKSHGQVLYAFELLWSQGRDVNLVIIGKQGWMVESLVAKLQAHPEHGKRLFWLPRIGDQELLKLYATCSALIAASTGEGFGLPLIEAAMHGLPIVARDLPVFHEVCGAHALYFSGNTAAALAGALEQWLALDGAGQAPQSRALPYLTWAASAAQLTQVMCDGQWYLPAVPA